MMGWITTILASGPARKALGLLLAVLTIALFILNLRRAGERAGRLAERLSTTEKTNAGCWTPPAVALGTAMILLIGCAGVGSEIPAHACPPIVEYSRDEQARVADELTALPEGSVIVGWLADYSVLRDQARMCR